MEEKENQFSKYSTCELFEIEKRQNEYILKTKKAYSQAEAINVVLSVGAAGGMLTLLIAKNPIIKLTGLILGVGCAIGSMAYMYSPTYLKKKHEYENAVKANKELKEELEERLLEGMSEQEV